jgi:uncharacterized protein YbjT (DUF2867 family)
MAEKALVVGATGFTGRAVVEVLCTRGIETTAHVRPDSSSLDRWRKTFEALGARVDTTPWTDEAMTETVRALSPTVVFSLLGTTRARARTEGRSAEAAYEAVDYGLSMRLLRAAEAATPPPRFVYLSAIGADSGRGAYMDARKRVEAALRDSRVPWIIARPSFIVGARDESRSGERIGAAVTDGLLSVAGALGARRLRARYRSTSNQALAERLVDLAFDADATGRIHEGADLAPVV